MTANTDDSAVMALRTPLYLFVAALGVLIAISAFLPWAEVDRYDGSGTATSVVGFEAGGWGEAAFVAGLIIAALGVLGYFWNPFSDPEAWFIAGFAGATLVAAIVKLVDTASLVDPAGEFDIDPAPGLALWLIAIAAALAAGSALWIAYDRPRAEARIGD